MTVNHANNPTVANMNNTEYHHVRTISVTLHCLIMVLARVFSRFYCVDNLYATKNAVITLINEDDMATV